MATPLNCVKDVTMLTEPEVNQIKQNACNSNCCVVSSCSYNYIALFFVTDDNNACRLKQEQLVMHPSSRLKLT